MAPLLVTLGLLYPVASMITYMTREKELKQKEMMKMMSVLETDFEWAWFCTFALVHVVTASCAAGVSSILYAESSLALLWVFWMFTFLAVIPFSMACSALTSKSSRAVVVGLLVFFSGSFMALAVDFQAGSPSVISVISLHPVAAFSYGIKILGYLEDVDLGLVDATLDYSDGLSGLRMLDIYRCLVIDTLLWSVMFWYLNRVIVPDYGQALPFWFPFDVTSYFGGFDRRDADARWVSKGTVPHDSILIERVGESLRRQAEQGKSIEIHSLQKNYGEKAAVDGLTLSMYSGQITALLGHNGAGKTTTIGMLTGAISPTAGYATVAGKDIRNGMPEIRQDIGICLQHDCLFPELTVREHIQFYARVKGLYSKNSRLEAEKQVDQALIDVALSEKRNTLSKNLSGGMKRKLSVAIAFCGGSKVVILDEPTAGQDPFSRRFTWNVIRNYKKDRIIILTTHFMDEADILGDRIAIMADGRLRCVGSSLFLKKTYGVGYQLTIDKGQDCARRYSDDLVSNVEDLGSSDSRSTCESVEVMSVASQDRKLKRIVTDAVREASLLSSAGSELSFQLPLSSAKSFAPLFIELDQLVETGAISCYGVSVTTLNEVFHMVTKGDTFKPAVTKTSRHRRSSYSSDIGHDTIHSVDTTLESDYGEDETDTESLDRCNRSMELEAKGLFARHVVALLKKRGSYFRRDKKAWMCTTIVPSLFVLVGFVVFAFAVPNRDLPPLTLKLEDYNPHFEFTPIAFNNPDNPFRCQPGACSHREPFNDIELTNETYVYCGYEGKLGASSKGYTPTSSACSVSDSVEVMSSISSASALVGDIGVHNVTEVRSDLQ
jgi:ATP-binding cassette, subfamily A (ABC1), member 3